MVCHHNAAVSATAINILALTLQVANVDGLF
jgi:hypothetical protein